jgi:hypothetical protein
MFEWWVCLSLNGESLGKTKLLYTKRVTHKRKRVWWKIASLKNKQAQYARTKFNIVGVFSKTFVSPAFIVYSENLWGFLFFLMSGKKMSLKEEDNIMPLNRETASLSDVKKKKKKNLVRLNCF